MLERISSWWLQAGRKVTLLAGLSFLYRSHTLRVIPNVPATEGTRGFGSDWCSMCHYCTHIEHQFDRAHLLELI